MPDTIYALASAYGKAGVSVLRVSGPSALGVGLGISGRATLQERMATFCRLRSPDTGDVLDESLLLYFKAPASYTGDDVLEIQTHGSLAVLEAVMGLLSRWPSVRLAEPGEFTKRAFLNGKLDLVEAEGVADLIEAETEEQRKQAYRQMSGHTGHVYRAWSERLKHLLARAEAAIDFSDEMTLDEDLKGPLKELCALLSQHMGEKGGERLRHGLHVALVGRPNAGKSSLFNALAQRDRAMVSSVPGTTRDTLEAHLNLGGYPLVLMDTAGVRSKGGRLEQEAAQRSLALAQASDMVVHVVDGSRAPWSFDGFSHDHSLCVVNKCDKVDTREGGYVFVSAHTGEGLEELKDHLVGKARASMGGHPLITRSRHREALGDVLQCVQRALVAPTEDLLAEDLRGALKNLGRLTGEVDVEELLDIIFREFCLGK